MARRPRRGLRQPRGLDGTGTIFHASKLSLTDWFRAMYHLSQCKNGISALELSRRLGVADNTAWMLHHKLMQVMFERDAGKPLEGPVHLDDSYIGGARSDGTTGRGASGKTPFLAAVQIAEDGKPHRVKFSRVADFSGKSIRQWAKRHLVAGCSVHSDGWPGFAGLAAAGHVHQVSRTSAVLTGQTRKRAADSPTFRWLNTLLGNLKTSLKQNLPRHRSPLRPALPRPGPIPLQSPLCPRANPPTPRLRRHPNLASSLPHPRQSGVSCVIR